MCELVYVQYVLHSEKTYIVVNLLGFIQLPTGLHRLVQEFGTDSSMECVLVCARAIIRFFVTSRSSCVWKSRQVPYCAISLNQRAHVSTKPLPNITPNARRSTKQPNISSKSRRSTTPKNHLIKLCRTSPRNLIDRKSHASPHPSPGTTQKFSRTCPNITLVDLPFRLKTQPNASQNHLDRPPRSIKLPNVSARSSHPSFSTTQKLSRTCPKITCIDLPVSIELPNIRPEPPRSTPPINQTTELYREITLSNPPAQHKKSAEHVPKSPRSTPRFRSNFQESSPNHLDQPSPL